MVEKARRKELQEQFKHAPLEAGVYRIVNARNHRGLLGSSANLASVRNKLAFAQTTGSVGALDHQLREDYLRYGGDAFSVEVLDRLEVKPEMTEAQIAADLVTLEQLWRERLGPDELY